MGQNRDLSRFPNAITVLDNGNVLLNTTTDSTSGFNKVLAISNDYLPSLELRKTGTIGGARTYNLAVGNTGGFSIYDATAATDRFVITSAGNVGIGTSSPSSIVKLDILLDATAVNGFQIRTSDAGTTDGSTTANVFRTVNSSAGNWANAKYNAWDHIFTTSGSTERMRITSGGALQLASSAYFLCGTTGYRFNSSTDAFNNFVALDNGNATLRGTLTQNASDERLKNNIQLIPDALNKINSLRGVTFEWNQEIYETSRTTDIGVIAQDIQSVLPDAVALAPFDTNFDDYTSKSGENYLTVYYEKIIPLLIEGIKELSAKVSALENKA
jgi:hypothetical protein